jgi:hypothetical protein
MKMRCFWVIFVLCVLNLPAYPQEKQPDNSDKLVILWTNDNLEVAKSMVFMYAHNAKKSKWFNEVTLIIWGTSSRLAAENEEVQKELARMKESGVKIEVCVSCAQMFGVDGKLRQLGYDVKGMGKPLSDYLKQNYKVLSI